jgi:hypothetical protein
VPRGTHFIPAQEGIMLARSWPPAVRAEGSKTQYLGGPTLAESFEGLQLHHLPSRRALRLCACIVSLMQAARIHVDSS